MTWPLLLTMGIALGGFAIHTASTVAYLEREGLRASGTIVGLDARTSPNGSSYYPLVQFDCCAGRSLQFRDQVGSNPPAYSNGDRVKVLYLADSPQSSARIDRGIGNWLLPGLLGLFSGVLGAMALSARARA